MKKRNLKRNIDLTFRVSQEERSLIYKRMEETGMKSRNAFLVKLVKDSTLYPVKEITETNLMFAEAIRIIRGTATNINQLAKVANATGRLADAEELAKAYQEITKQHRVMLGLWSQLRSLLNGSSKDRQQSQQIKSRSPQNP